MNSHKFSSTHIVLLEKLGYTVFVNKEDNYPDFAHKEDSELNLIKILSLSKGNGVLSKVECTDCSIFEASISKHEKYLNSVMDAHLFLEQLTRRH